jgi:hypothetical protein
VVGGFFFLYDSDIGTKSAREINNKYGCEMELNGYCQPPLINLYVRLFELDSNCIRSLGFAGYNGFELSFYTVYRFDIPHSLI